MKASPIPPPREELSYHKHLDLASYACGTFTQWVEPLAKLLEAASRGLGYLPEQEVRGKLGKDIPPAHLMIIDDGIAMLPRTKYSWDKIRVFFSESLQANSRPLNDAEVRASLDSILPYYVDENFSNLAQRRAIAALVDAKVGVLTGGPGTGKTTTAAALLSVYCRLQPDLKPEDVAICAPTGKAANRLRQSLLRAAQQLKLENSELDFLKALSPSTIHRALKWNGTAPENGGPFKYNLHNKLPHRFILVDEVSMVDTQLMYQLIQAIESEASLILLGDADQLDSVEAGGVLAELVLRGAADPKAPDKKRLKARYCPTVPDDLREGLPEYKGDQPLPGLSWALVHSWRAKSSPWILQCAKSCRPGANVTADEFTAQVSALEKAQATPLSQRVISKEVSFSELEENHICWLESQNHFDQICKVAWRALLDGSAKWNLKSTIEDREINALLGEFQLLCAFNHQVDRANQLALSMTGQRQLCHGFPIMIEENRPELGVVNGDIGLAIGAGPKSGAMVVYFPGLEAPLPVAHLPKYCLAFALSIHKSQGSEWKQVAIDLPAQASELLEPRLLYTAITRASKGLIFHAPQEGLRQILDPKRL